MTNFSVLLCCLFGFWSSAQESVLSAQAQESPNASTSSVDDGGEKERAGAPTDSKATAIDPENASGENVAAADAENASDEETSGFWDSLNELMHTGAMGLMIEGGIFMWPILVMGIVASAVIIERFRSLKMLHTDTAVLRSQVRSLLEQERVEEALHLCDGLQGPVPAILSAGLRKFLVLQRLDYDPGKIEEQVVKAMDDYGIHVVAALEKHLPSLATVSSAAPMVGFLGTVSGMVNSFKDIVAQLGEKNIVESAAAGISEALLTTALGLIVGIPAYVAFNYFTSVINRFVLEVEESATELIETVTLQMTLKRREAEESVVAESSVR